MRRAQYDKFSQAVRNLAYNPSSETTTGTTTTQYTNLAQNPSFETTSGTIDVRTNLCVNPAFDTVSGTSEVRRNLATNPSFEAASGTTNVRTNLVTHPSFQTASGSTMNYRVNLFNGSSNTLGAGATLATGVSYRGSTWTRVSATTALTGIRFLTNQADLVNGAVYAFQVEVANDGVSPVTVNLDWCDNIISGGSHTIEAKERKRITVTGSKATYDATYRFADLVLNADNTNILVREVLIEKDYIKGQYFDGATTAATYNYAQGKGGTASSGAPNVSISTDGGTETARYTEIGVGLSWIQIDLGAVQMLDTVKVWHYYTDARTYNATKTEVSIDGVSWFTIFDSAVSGTYPETSGGKIHSFSLRGVRYIRDWLNGSTSNGSNHWLEIQAFNLASTDFTYGWFGGAGTSTSFTRVNGLNGWGTLGMLYQSMIDPKFGTHSGALITTGANGDGLWPSVNLPVTAEKIYTYSAWIKATSAHALTFAFRWKDASDVTIGSDTIASVTSQLVVGSWARVTATATSPVGAINVQMMARIYETHTPTTLYFDGMTFIAGSIDVGHFDGSTAASGDFTYAWSGTANASTSHQQAPSVATWTNLWYGGSGGSGALYQAKGGLSGTYARKLWIQPNTGSSVDVGIKTPLTTISSNISYTLSTWVRTSVAQNYNFYIEWRDSGGSLISSTPKNVHTAVTSNTWTRLSVTGTSPSNATDAYFVVGPYSNGLTMPSGSTMDFDHVLVEASPVVKDYFDGTNHIKNLVTVPSFEDGSLGGWTNNSPDMVNSTAYPYVGTRSLRVTPTTENYGYFQAMQLLVPGRTYTFSVWVRSDQAQSMMLTNYNTPAVGPSVSVPANVWTRLRLTQTIPANATNAWLSVRDPARSLTLTPFYMDAFMIEETSELNPYYEGTGDFTYTWGGTPNSSVSIQTAPKPDPMATANQAVIYRTGTAGHYKGRLVFTNNTVGDSGINFAPAITTVASTTYTVSVNAISDITRTVKFSAQGSGTVTQNSSNITLTEGVPTRLSWTFSTSATAPASVYLYLLRADGLLGTIDLDEMIIEEGPAQNGGYFDGTKVAANLITNPSFETNTTGWVMDTGSPTLSSSSDFAFFGTKSLKAVNTVVNGDIAVRVQATLEPSTAYTMSYYVYSPDARTAAYIDAATTNFSLSHAGEKPLSAGVWTRVSATFTTTSNIIGLTSFYLHHAGGPTAIGTAIYIDAVLLEKSNHLNQFYEGAGDFTYAWTGTAHASTSVQRGVAVVKAASERAFAVSTTRNADKVVRVIPSNKGSAGFSPYSGSDVFINLWAQPPALTPNSTYTMVATIQNEAVLSGPPKFRFNIDNVDQSSPLLPTTVGEHSVTWQFTTGANSTVNFMRFMPGPSGVAGYTNEVLLKRFMIVEGIYVGPYFDGSTSATSDFTYNWTATAHNSTSTLKTSPGVSSSAAFRNTSLANSKFLTYQSIAEDGVKVTKWVAPAGTPNSGWRVAGYTSTGFDYSKIKAGGRYTLWFRWRGYGWANASAVQVQLSASTGLNHVITSENITMNQSGWQEYRRTFTALRDGDSAQMLYISLPAVPHATTDGIFEIRDWGLFGGEYLGDLITGDNSFSRWEGTPNASTSLGYPPQLLDIAGKPEFDLAGVGTVTLPGGYGDQEPRTFYTVYHNYLNINGGAVQSFLQYGEASLSDTVANTSVTVRQQSFTTAANALNVRRTGGGGSVVTPQELGVHVACWGITSAGYIFCQTDERSARVVDNVVMSIPHQKIMTFDSAWQKNVRTIMYRGEHNAATRQAVARYLGNKYGANVA